MSPIEDSERKAAAMRERLRREAEERTSKAKPSSHAVEDSETRAAAMREKLQREAEERVAKAKPRSYVVKAGDSLSKIAKEVLGDASRWTEIFEANKDKIKDPNVISPGQELRLPS